MPSDACFAPSPGGSRAAPLVEGQISTMHSTAKAAFVARLRAEHLYQSVRRGVLTTGDARRAVARSPELRVNG